MASRHIPILAIALALAPFPALAQAIPPREIVSVEGPAGRQFEQRIEAAKQAMMADPSEALALSRQAAALLRAVPPSERRMLAQARAQWLEGESLARVNKMQEAEALIERTLSLVERHQPGSKLHGDLLMTRAAIAADSGQVQPALEAFQKAHSVFAALGEARSQSIALQNIGGIYSEAGDYERVLKYYAQSAEVYAGDPSLSMAAYNNRGTAMRDMGRYAEADKEYRRALALARETESPLLEARVLNNIASTQLLAGKLDQADRTARAGLRLTADPDAAEWAPFLWGVRAQVAHKRGDLKAAAQLLDRTFSGTDLTETSPFHRDFHDTAQQVYAALGDAQRALEHLRAFNRLDDEAQKVRSSAVSVLTAAQFDFANQELQISKLKTEQLTRDIALAQSRARTNMIILAGLVAALAIVSVAFFVIRRSRNQTRAANDNLNVSNTALEKALKAKSEFLATTSHEIRTPLNGILGMTQVLLRDRSLAAEARDRVKAAHSAGETMKAVVDDILDMAKIETGRIEMTRVPFDLPPLLEEVGHLWQGQAQEKGVALTIDIAAAPGRIVEDDRRLRQVVFNLISNAVKFTEAGAVTLTVTTRPSDVGEALVITVADSGIGIPDDKFEAIFESFSQVDGSTSRKYGGTGLGLTISRNLVTAMGGTIDVASTLGSGSTFTVTLPLERAEPVAGRRTASDGPVGFAECALLLVEGNPLFQAMTKATLEDEVAHADAVDDIAEAIALAATRHFDVVLIDFESGALGALDGLAALRDLRAALPHSRLLVHASEDDAADPAILMSCGADAVIAKSFPALGLAEELMETFERLAVTPLAPATQDQDPTWPMVASR